MPELCKTINNWRIGVKKLHLLGMENNDVIK